MRIFRHSSSLPPSLRGAAVAIGNFDGVHLGHRAVIGAAGAAARWLGAPLAVLTFEPHPRRVFQPMIPPFRLTPFRVKARLLEGLGVDLLVNLHFDLELAAWSAEDFVRRVLVEGMAARHVVVGYDFVFGHRRRGTPALLEELGRAAGFGVTVEAPMAAPAPPSQSGKSPSGGSGSGEIYSSTRIREHLAAGRVRAAAVLLGRPWEIDGRVESGDRRGRTIGFPTANLALDEYLRPAAGVYAVHAGIEGAHGTAWHRAVANLGWRPTFGGTDLRLEVHLLDFSGDLYGQHLRALLVEHLRPERKFSGIAELKEQIARDSEAARAALARLPAAEALLAGAALGDGAATAGGSAPGMSPPG